MLERKLEDIQFIDEENLMAVLDEDNRVVEFFGAMVNKLVQKSLKLTKS